MSERHEREIGGFPGGSVGKESTCNVGDLGSVPGLGRSPGGGQGNPPQYSCLENPQGQRSLAGCSSWSHKESDMTEQLIANTLHCTAETNTRLQSSYTPIKNSKKKIAILNRTGQF